VTIGELTNMRNLKHLISVLLSDGLSHLWRAHIPPADMLLGDTWDDQNWRLSSEKEARSLVHEDGPVETFPNRRFGPSVIQRT
jgi:hypothetical protein